MLLTGAAGWGWGSRGISHPGVPSHRASRPCQPSLGEQWKHSPSGGLWCSFEQSIPKTSSVELPFSHGQSLPGQERSAGDRLHTRLQYPAAAFSTNSLFLLNMTYSNPRLRWFQCFTSDFCFTFTGFRYKICVAGCFLQLVWSMPSRSIAGALLHRTYNQRGIGDRSTFVRLLMAWLCICVCMCPVKHTVREAVIQQSGW